MPGEKAQATDTDPDSDLDVKSPELSQLADAPVVRKDEFAKRFRKDDFAKVEVNTSKFTQHWAGTEMANVQQNYPGIELLNKSSYSGTKERRLQKRNRRHKM